MKENILGIIFDCDGTLVDTEHAHFLSWQKAVHKRGMPFSKEEYAPFAGNNAIHVSRKLQEKLPTDSPEAIYHDKHQAYQEFHKSGIPLIERTVRFLRVLIERREELQIKLAVASAAPKRELLNNLEHLGLTHAFEAIVSGEDDLSHISDPEGVNKPKPYIYLHTAGLLGLKPSRCVAFEDSRTGVLAAVSAGLITFAVPNAYTSQHDLSSATFLIDPQAEIDVDEFFRKVRSRIN
ncbi:MAG: HAD family phosphatase [Chlamydiales bacterium]|nr:HAD family phosphatase [Chlamydiales bacterium]